MAAFYFIAVNQKGQEQKGVIEAETEKHARQLIRNQSLVPIQIRTAHQKKQTINEGKFKLFAASARLSNKELALLTRQFATLLTAGLPIEEALQALSEQAEKERVKGLILSVRSKVMEGHTLARALRDQNDVFSDLYCATIAAGEKSGFLDKILQRLADYTEQQWAMNQKLKTALIYPVMIVFVAVGIVGFLLEFVVPKMVGIYAHLNQALPTMTAILIASSDLIKTFGLPFILFSVIGFFLWRRALKKSPSLREKTHFALLRLPLVGYTVKTSNTARFARTLSILSSAGVPILEAMKIAGNLIMCMPIKKSVEQAVDRIREGAAIYLALKQTRYFTPMSVHMISSGEASGQLEAMLERVAKMQEDEIMRLIEVALALFEPAIILIMGAIVLFIVLAVLLPIFQLNQFNG